MIKTYKIKGGEFKTITIPKGTILFRGISCETFKDYHRIFNDLIGYRKDKYYTISPTMNVFFYLVPYASDAVNIYDIHVMYVTQYDIELLLLINPSTHTRKDTRSDIDDNYLHKLITTCENISELDKCGFNMSGVDPCFTDLMLKRYPNIDGYIAIAQQDASMFFKRYRDLVNQGRAKYIISSLLSDSRGEIGIPEIVLHPLRFKNTDCTVIGERFYNSEQIVKYCIKYRAQYNYFPLIYFTNGGINTFTDLAKEDTIKNIIKYYRAYNSEIPKIYSYIQDVFDALLHTNGYSINGVTYKAGIDVKTGFYKLYTNKSNKSNKSKTLKRKQVMHTFKNDDFMGYINTISSYPKNDIISHTNYLDRYLNDLYINGYSPKKKLLLNRGEPNSLIYNYHIDRVINRPELDNYRKIRQKKNKNTRKNIHKDMSYMLDFSNGLDFNNISNINIEDNIE